MEKLGAEAATFQAAKEAQGQEARQRAALQIACGLDLDSMLQLSRDQRRPIIERIDRALRCERLKGLRRHWSYDLNRHIALKQALDRLRGTGTAQKPKRRHARRSSKTCIHSP